jgi:hypothetical protein
MRAVTVDVEYRCGGAKQGYRPRDVQNALSSLKAAFDALQDAGIVPSDAEKWLALGEIELLTRATDHRVKTLGPGVTFTIHERP